MVVQETWANNIKYEEYEEYSETSTEVNDVIKSTISEEIK